MGYGLQVRGLEVGHADGGVSSFYAFITQFTSTAVKCLLFIEDRKHGEDHRHVSLCIEDGDSLGDRLADVIEVRGIALDDTANHNNGMQAFFLYHAGCSKRQLSGSTPF